MGDGGKEADTPKASKTASKIAKAYYKDTDPMRQTMIGNFENFLDGGYDVAQNPVWGAGRGVIEDQYDVARENVIGNMPKGGALTDQLAGVEESRASALGQLGGNVAQDEYNKLYGMSTGAPGQAMGPLAQVGGQQAMANAQQQSGKFGALGDMGMGAGYVLGSK
jgi:hypothetical protein